MPAELRLGIVGLWSRGTGRAGSLVDRARKLVEARLGRLVKVQRVYLRDGSKTRDAVPQELLTDDPSRPCALAKTSM